MKKISDMIIRYLKMIELEHLILLAIIFLAYYYQLGVFPIYLWDEGVYASNAIEMLHNGNFLIKYYDNQPEMWATQPPLVAWLQTLSIWTFGINETAIRLPSALAATTIAISIYRFLRLKFRSSSWGFFAASILSLSPGFVTIHVARTADLDIFVTMFSLLYILAFYKFYLSGFTSKKYCFLFIFFVFCAFFSKTIAGLIFLPAVLGFILLSKQRKAFFKNFWMYIFMLIFLALTVSYYWYHESVTPGYIEAAFVNEFWGRFTGQIHDVHPGPFLFYWESLRYEGFLPWIFFIPISFFFIIFSEKETRRFFIFVGSVALFYWLIISFSAVKLYWYNAQLYPLLSIIAAFGLKSIYDAVLSFMKDSGVVKKSLLLFFFTATFLLSNAFQIEEKNLYNARNGNSDLLYGIALKDIANQFPDIKEIYMLQPGFSPNVTFYKNYYNLFLGYNLKYFEISENIPITPESYVLYFNTAVTNILDYNYNYELLYQYKEMVFIHVKDRKTPLPLYYGTDPDRDLELLTSRNRITEEKAFTGNRSLALSSINQFSLIWKFSKKELQQNQIQKIRFTCYAMTSDSLKSGYVVYTGDSCDWTGIPLKSFIKIKDSWNFVDTTFDISTFHNSKNSFIHLYIWNNNPEVLLLDDIAFELIKK